MTRNHLELLLPGPEGNTDRWRWGTVTQAAPLRLRLDGDDVALDLTPDDLTGGAAVGRRVRVLITGRRVEVHGVAGGPEWPGVIKQWAGGTTPPPGYLPCDGTAVGRTACAALFAVIGTTYGAGDGSTTFNLPNFVGRVPVGHASGDSDFGNMGQAGGAKTHILAADEIPDTTTRRRVNSGAFETGAGNAPIVSGTGTRHQYAPIAAAAAHNNVQPYLVVRFVIKT